MEKLNRTEIKTLDGIVQEIDKINDSIDSERDDSVKYIVQFLYSNMTQIKLVLIVFGGGILVYCVLKRKGSRNIRIAAIPMRETSL